jgi:hypothetical protein
MRVKLKRRMGVKNGEKRSMRRKPTLRYQQLSSNVTGDLIPDAGHFTQEEVAREVWKRITAFAGTCQS